MGLLRIDAAIDGLLAKIPDAYLIVKFSESAPDWWREKHPGELVQTSVGGQTAPLLLPKSEGPMLKRTQQQSSEPSRVGRRPCGGRTYPMPSRMPCGIWNRGQMGNASSGI